MGVAIKQGCFSAVNGTAIRKNESASASMSSFTTYMNKATPSAASSPDISLKVHLFVPRSGKVGAVVDEQVATESFLLSQGEQTAASLEARQDDVERLLGKVDRLNAEEVTKSFVSTLNASNTDLPKQVFVLAVQSKDRSVTLCAGVEQILSRGRSTCETLKGSIDSALPTTPRPLKTP